MKKARVPEYYEGVSRRLWLEAQKKAVSLVEKKAIRRYGEYGPDKRIAVLRDYLLGLPLTAITRRHEISQTTVYNWKRFYGLTEYKPRRSHPDVIKAIDAVVEGMATKDAARKFKVTKDAISHAARVRGVKLPKQVNIRSNSTEQARLHQLIRAARLRLRGLTYEVVGEKMGVRRQRVFQILNYCPSCAGHSRGITSSSSETEGSSEVAET